MRVVFENATFCNVITDPIQTQTRHECPIFLIQVGKTTAQWVCSCLIFNCPWSSQADWVYSLGVITALPSGIDYWLLICSLVVLSFPNAADRRVQRATPSVPTCTGRGSMPLPLVNSVFPSCSSLIRRRSSHFPSVLLCFITGPRSAAPQQEHSAEPEGIYENPILLYLRWWLG